jgi:hypothetical protein
MLRYHERRKVLTPSRYFFSSRGHDLQALCRWPWIPVRLGIDIDISGNLVVIIGRDHLIRTQSLDKLRTGYSEYAMRNPEYYILG